ncbi:hypothetical protein LCGC14_2627930 [marine sediment metagenome]|uniref:HTH cro/C1-type domain-containing protein n=1 Tax=marine sediment metagenome TaxID=412755 RepID=A0A0F9A1A2_9ZZZZ
MPTPHPMTRKIAATLREIREKKNMKQSAIADALNIEVSNVSRMENGKHDITGTQFVLWCDKLDITPSSICTVVEADLTDDSNTGRFAQLISQMTSNKKDQWFDYGEYLLEQKPPRADAS